MKSHKKYGKKKEKQTNKQRKDNDIARKICYYFLQELLPDKGIFRKCTKKSKFFENIPKIF